MKTQDERKQVSENFQHSWLSRFRRSELLGDSGVTALTSFHMAARDMLDSDHRFLLHRLLGHEDDCG